MKKLVFALVITIVLLLTFSTFAIAASDSSNYTPFKFVKELFYKIFAGGITGAVPEGCTDSDGDEIPDLGCYGVVCTGGNNISCDDNCPTVTNTGQEDTSTPAIYGTPVTFTKADYADPTNSANQDCITGNVCITRGNSQGIYNSVTESGYNYPDPTDTEWAWGDCSIATGFTDWYSWHGGNPPNALEKLACLHLITDNLYFNIIFTSWTSGASGGGFSYTRTQYTPSVQGNGIGDACDCSDGICDGREKQYCIDHQTPDPACAECGNGIKEGTEQCDDGNKDNYDGCTNTCCTDQDHDGVCDTTDNCKTVYNLDQLDSDHDGTGNVCDSCPYDPNNDIDGDGFCGDVDNCPTVPNPGQEDADRDGNGDACDPFNGPGTGTPQDPYNITDCQSLQQMKNDLDAYYILGKDINCLETASWNPDSNGGYYGFIPVGDSTNPFTGNFDGNNHIITDIYINTYLNDVGLFGYISNATIKNVGLKDVSVTAHNNAGSLVGKAYYSSNISNSYATGTITGAGNVGGLVGQINVEYSSSTPNTKLSSVIIADCFTSGTVVGEYSVGGLVGDAVKAVINNSYSFNNVYSSGDNIGGLVGQFGFGYGYANIPFIEPVISNSSANGNVNGYNNVGGLVGRTSHPSIINCYATGNVTGVGSISSMGYTTGNGVGGLVGKSEGFGTGLTEENEANMLFTIINNSHANGTVTGSEVVGGLVGISGGTKIFNSSATGNVNGNTNVGGLVGEQGGSSIYNSYATGTVNGSNNIGGLAGYGYGTIYDSYANGSVSGNSNIGGLAGYSTSFKVNSSYATGSVTGNIYVGGLAGIMYNSKISTSYATGSVIGNNYYDENHDYYASSNVGGLVGRATSSATIDSSYAISNVIGGDNVGGLVGTIGSDSSGATVSNSYSNGTVTGIQIDNCDCSIIEEGPSCTSAGCNWADNVYECSAIDSFYCQNYPEFYPGCSWDEGSQTCLGTYIEGGNCTGTYKCGGREVGGLVGLIRNGYVSNSYTISKVAGSIDIGGLIGSNKNNGITSNSFAAGTVTGSNNVGGLVGINLGTITDSYWDACRTGQNYCVGYNGSNYNINPEDCYEKNNNTDRDTNYFYTINNSPMNADLGVWDFESVWNPSYNTICYPILNDIKGQRCMQLDDSCAGPVCTDGDKDGYGAEGTDTSACDGGPKPDCNDNDPNVHAKISCQVYTGQTYCETQQLCVTSCPTNPAEICDGKDNDCDKIIDNGGNNLCDNGQWCDGQETCQGTIGCQAGTAPNCNDNINCTYNSCDEQKDSCSYLPDNTKCPTAGTCDGNGYVYTGICDVAQGCTVKPAPISTTNISAMFPLNLMTRIDKRIDSWGVEKKRLEFNNVGTVPNILHYGAATSPELTKLRYDKKEIEFVSKSDLTSFTETILNDCYGGYTKTTSSSGSKNYYKIDKTKIAEIKSPTDLINISDKDIEEEGYLSTNAENALQQLSTLLDTYQYDARAKLDIIKDPTGVVTIKENMTEGFNPTLQAKWNALVLLVKSGVVDKTTIRITYESKSPYWKSKITSNTCVLNKLTLVEGDKGALSTAKINAIFPLLMMLKLEKKIDKWGFEKKNVEFNNAGDIANRLYSTITNNYVDVMTLKYNTKYNDYKKGSKEDTDDKDEYYKLDFESVADPTAFVEAQFAICYPGYVNTVRSSGEDYYSTATSGSHKIGKIRKPGNSKAVKDIDKSGTTAISSTAQGYINTIDSSLTGYTYAVKLSVEIARDKNGTVTVTKEEIKSGSISMLSNWQSMKTQITNDLKLVIGEQKILVYIHYEPPKQRWKVDLDPNACMIQKMGLMEGNQQACYSMINP